MFQTFEIASFCFGEELFATIREMFLINQTNNENETKNRVNENHVEKKPKTDSDRKRTQDYALRS